MNTTSVFLSIIGLLFYSWLVWMIYQLYLASWHRDNAKERWINIFSTPAGIILQPFLKWIILVIFIAGAFALTFYFIDVLMKLTLFVMEVISAT